MATMSRPAPLTPRNPIFPKLRRPRRSQVAPATSAAAAAAAEQAPAPSTYTRSALPLALTWFLVPAVLLVLSQYFSWTK